MKLVSFTPLCFLAVSLLSPAPARLAAGEPDPGLEIGRKPPADNKPPAPNTPDAAWAAFYHETEAEAVIKAGQQCFCDIKSAELPKVLARLVEFPSPLPAMSLGGLLVKGCDPDKLRTQLNKVKAAEWWAVRNLLLLCEQVPDRTLVKPIFQEYLTAARCRPVRLEAITALAHIRDPEASKQLQAIYTGSKDLGERTACLRGLAGCGAEADVPWLLRQCQANTPESVAGAWAITQLIHKLPRQDTLFLLNHPATYARRAGLLLLRALGTKEDWFTLLKAAKELHSPEVLEAAGNYFARNPTGEATAQLLATKEQCDSRDFRVRDAWCLAIGACAAAGDNNVLKEQALSLFSSRVLPARDLQFKDTHPDALRGPVLAAIFGLGALKTEAANNVLSQIALEFADEAVALYAGMELLLSKDPAVLKK